MLVVQNKLIRQIGRFIQEKRGLFLFVVLLLVSHFMWKGLMDEDIKGDRIGILGYDLSPYFHSVSLLTTRFTVWLLQIIWNDSFNVQDTVISYFNGSKLQIIWGCTAIKQMFMFAVIFLFCQGPTRHKYWYFPLGCFFIFIFNIFRIAIIAHYSGLNLDNFEPLHELFRYVFYGYLFFLWVFWEEYYNIPYQNCILKMSVK